MWFWGVDRFQSKQNKVIRKATTFKPMHGIEIRDVSIGLTQIAVIDEHNDLYILGRHQA
jgi:hypothetical protein